jgi:hypothetical protein
MLIDRRAHAFQQGTETVALQPAHVFWAEGGVHFAKESVHDFGHAPTIHDYDVSVSLDELRQVIDAVAAASRDVDRELVAKALGPSLKSLLQLVNSIVDAKD